MMGYMTRFELAIHKGELEMQDVYRQYMNMRKFAPNTYPEYAGFEWAFDEDGESRDELKWYDAEGDTEMFSKYFADTVFVLTGIGEENGDQWKLYVKNGKSVRKNAVVTIPPLEEGEL